MEIPKYIVFRVDVMRKGTSVELTNITDDVEDVILKAEQTETNCSEKPNNCDEPQTENLFTDKYGDVWEWRGDAWYCISGQDEPQTDCDDRYALRTDSGEVVAYDCPLSCEQTERSE